MLTLFLQKLILSDHNGIPATSFLLSLTSDYVYKKASKELGQQFALARKGVARTFIQVVGSSNFFKTVEGVGVNALPFMTRASTLRIKFFGRARLLLRYQKSIGRKRIVIPQRLRAALAKRKPRHILLD